MWLLWPGLAVVVSQFNPVPQREREREEEEEEGGGGRGAECTKEGGRVITPKTPGVLHYRLQLDTYLKRVVHKKAKAVAVLTDPEQNRFQNRFGVKPVPNRRRAQIVLETGLAPNRFQTGGELKPVLKPVWA
jgi:hypothetical protein